MKIIAVSGKKNSGKDSVANILVEAERFNKIALSDPLKSLLCRVFYLEPKYFQDEKLKEDELPEYINLDYVHIDKIRDIVENEWGFVIEPNQRERMENHFGEEIKTPRQLMQTIGTDILRNNVRDDIFVVLLFSRMKEINGNVVISDVRWKNERDALKKAGAHLLLVKRSTYINAKRDEHDSENSLGKDDEYDVVVNNEDISLNQLRSEILMWYSVAAKYRVTK